MAPRKASNIKTVAPQRSSVRLRLRKQQNSSHLEEEIAGRSDEPLVFEVPHSLIWHSLRKKQEHLPLITEQDSSSSETLKEVESDNKTDPLSSLRMTHPEFPGVEKEREVFDPAWRQFRDPTCEPTLDDTYQSMTLEGSGHLSPLSETAFDGIDRVSQGDRLPGPLGAQEPLCEDPMLIADDIDSATIRYWLATSQAKWEHVSRTGCEVVQKTYRKSTSTLHMLELRGREDPLAPLKGIVIRTLGILAVLVLFLSIITIPLKTFDTDLNDASMRAGRAASVDTINGSLPMSCADFASREWSQFESPSTDPGRHSDSGAEEQVSPKNETLSDDEQATSKSQWKVSRGLHNQICERLQNVPREVVTYYLEVRANTIDIYKHARYDDNVTTQSLKDKSHDATEDPKVAFLHALPVWQMRMAPSNDLATSLLQTSIDLQSDLSALMYKLNATRKRVALTKPDVVQPLSWLKRAARWTAICKHEKNPVSAHTKAIALIDQWLAETSALNKVVNEVYFELEKLDKMIRNVTRKRLSVNVQFSSNSAGSYDLTMFLLDISQEIRRIYKLAQSSKSMQGWGKEEESKERNEAEKLSAEYYANFKRRIAARPRTSAVGYIIP